MKRGEGEGEADILSLLNAKECSLLLGKLSLTKVPDEVFWHSEHLTVLDLQWNELQSLPSSMSTLQRLKHLNVRNNKLSEIPGSVPSLAALRILQVPSCALSFSVERLLLYEQYEQLLFGAVVCVKRFGDSKQLLRAAMTVHCLS